MKKLILCIALAALALVGCSKKDEEFKYSLTENQCETGEHKADSKSVMCAQLKNDEVNHGCATHLRKEKFEGDGCGSWGG